MGDLIFSVTCFKNNEWAKNFWGLNVNKLLINRSNQLDHEFFVLDATEISNLITNLWGSNQYAPTGLVTKRSNETIQIIRDVHTDSWVLANQLTRKTIVVFDSIKKLPEWYRGSPLRLPMAMFCKNHHISLIHGGAIEQNGKCKIFLGDGGSGKSSSVIKYSLLGDYKILADDYFAYDYLRGMVYPLYCSIKLKEDNFQKYQKYVAKAETGKNQAKEKRIINVEKLELIMSQGGLIHEILLPSSTKGSEDKIITNDIFRAVIPSTLTGLMNRHSFALRSFSILAHFQNKRWMNWRER